MKIDLRPFKITTWPGTDLKGLWRATIKVDGVLGIKTDDGWVSRNNKPLYNLPKNYKNGCYEIFLGSFKKTISALKTIYKTDVNINAAITNILELKYNLLPIENPTADEILYLFNRIRELGHEGIVLSQNDIYYKVKSINTIDLEVIDWAEGNGKLKGMMGKVLTKHGWVGSGFDNKERKLFTKEFILGKLIEVAYMEMTEQGKLRHPRFASLREDL